MSQCTYFFQIYDPLYFKHALLFFSSTPCVLCIETKIEIVNQNKEKITLKIFTRDRVRVGMG